MNNPSNLPPGCSDRDIEEAAGAIRRCVQCGDWFAPDDVDENVCQKCDRADYEEKWKDKNL